MYCVFISPRIWPHQPHSPDSLLKYSTGSANDELSDWFPAVTDREHGEVTPGMHWAQKILEWLPIALGGPRSP